MDTMASDTRPVDSNASPSTIKERRPFLKLAPLVVTRELPGEIGPGLMELEERVGDDVQIIVRALVNFTVARQITEQRRTGRAVGVPYPVLNRRRRAGREWIIAILGGKVDAATLHSVTHSWIPQLAGTGPEVGEALAAGDDLIEFVRGAISALVMTDIAANLMPHARALHALETVLGVYLRALHEAADGAANPT